MFFISSFGPIPKARAAIDGMILPTPGTMVNLSPAYEPTLIKGLTIHKDNPFLFDFIVDTGHSKLTGDELKREGDRLIKYFFACLTIPQNDLWVNLSPYEKNRMIPQALGQTTLGRDLLAQDYILKQLTASLIYPEKELGKSFWEKIYTKSREMYGKVEVPINTFNKVWIVAEKASVYEHGQTVFVVGGHLKVLLEADYLALQKASAFKSISMVQKNEGLPQNNAQEIGTEVVREIIIPEIEKEVNTGKNFARLRQIFYSQILATWYKKNLKDALLTQVYADKSTVKGITMPSSSRDGKVLTPQEIYQQYLQAYKRGVFNYIKEDVQPDGQSIPRKYFSGGYFGANLAMSSETDPIVGARAVVPTASEGFYDFSTVEKINSSLPSLPPASSATPAMININVAELRRKIADAKQSEDQIKVWQKEIEDALLNKRKISNDYEIWYRNRRFVVEQFDRYEEEYRSLTRKLHGHLGSSEDREKIEHRIKEVSEMLRIYGDAEESRKSLEDESSYNRDFERSQYIKPIVLPINMAWTEWLRRRHYHLDETTGNYYYYKAHSSESEAMTAQKGSAAQKLQRIRDFLGQQGGIVYGHVSLEKFSEEQAREFVEEGIIKAQQQGARFVPEIAMRGSAEIRGKALKLIRDIRERYPNIVMAAGGVSGTEASREAVEAGVDIILTLGFVLGQRDIDWIRDQGCEVFLGVGSLKEAEAAKAVGVRYVTAFPFRINKPATTNEVTIKSPIEEIELALKNSYRAGIPEEYRQDLDNYVLIVDPKEAPAEAQEATFGNILTFLRSIHGHGEGSKKATTFKRVFWGDDFLNTLNKVFPASNVTVAGGILEKDMATLRGAGFNIARSMNLEEAKKTGESLVKEIASRTQLPTPAVTMAREGTANTAMITKDLASADGQYMATLAQYRDDAEINVVKDQQVVLTIPVPLIEKGFKMEFSPDSKYLAVVNARSPEFNQYNISDNYLMVWDLKAQKRVVAQSTGRRYLEDFKWLDQNKLSLRFINGTEQVINSNMTNDSYVMPRREGWRDLGSNGIIPLTKGRYAMSFYQREHLQDGMLFFGNEKLIVFQQGQGRILEIDRIAPEEIVKYSASPNSRYYAMMYTRDEWNTWRDHSRTNVYLTIIDFQQHKYRTLNVGKTQTQDGPSFHWEQDRLILKVNGKQKEIDVQEALNKPSVENEAMTAQDILKFFDQLSPEERATEKAWEEPMLRFLRSKAPSMTPYALERSSRFPIFEGGSRVLGVKYNPATKETSNVDINELRKISQLAMGGIPTAYHIQLSDENYYYVVTQDYVFSFQLIPPSVESVDSLAPLLKKLLDQVSSLPVDVSYPSLRMAWESIAPSGAILKGFENLKGIRGITAGFGLRRLQDGKFQVLGYRDVRRLISENPNKVFFRLDVPKTPGGSSVDFYWVVRMGKHWVAFTNYDLGSTPTNRAMLSPQQEEEAIRILVQKEEYSIEELIALGRTFGLNQEDFFSEIRRLAHGERFKLPTGQWTSFYPTYNEDGTPTGKVKSYWAGKRDRNWNRNEVTFVRNTKGELLLQIRKDGSLDVSTGGGIEVGLENEAEKKQTALNETLEEFYLDLNRSSFHTIRNINNKHEFFQMDFDLKNEQEKLDKDGIYYGKPKQIQGREIYDVFKVQLDEEQEREWENKKNEKGKTAKESMMTWEDFLSGKKAPLNNEVYGIVAVDPKVLRGWYEKASLSKRRQRLAQGLNGLLAFESIQDSLNQVQAHPENKAMTAGFIKVNPNQIEQKPWDLGQFVVTESIAPDNRLKRMIQVWAKDRPYQKPLVECTEHVFAFGVSPDNKYFVIVTPNTRSWGRFNGFYTNVKAYDVTTGKEILDIEKIDPLLFVRIQTTKGQHNVAEVRTNYEEGDPDIRWNKEGQLVLSWNHNNPANSYTVDINKAIARAKGEEFSDQEIQIAAMFKKAGLTVEEVQMNTKNEGSDIIQGRIRKSPDLRRSSRNRNNSSFLYMGELDETYFYDEGAVESNEKADAIVRTIELLNRVPPGTMKKSFEFQRGSLIAKVQGSLQAVINIMNKGDVAMVAELREPHQSSTIWTHGKFLITEKPVNHDEQRVPVIEVWAKDKSRKDQLKVSHEGGIYRYGFSPDDKYFVVVTPYWGSHEGSSGDGESDLPTDEIFTNVYAYDVGSGKHVLDLERFDWSALNQNKGTIDSRHETGNPDSVNWNKQGQLVLTWGSSLGKRDHKLDINYEVDKYVKTKAALETLRSDEYSEEDLRKMFEEQQVGGIVDWSGFLVNLAKQFEESPTSRAMTTQKIPTAMKRGGIDLNAANMGMTLTKDAQGGVKVSFDPAMIARIRQQGVQSAFPLIIDVHLMPLAEIRPLLGLNDNPPQQAFAKV